MRRWTPWLAFFTLLAQAAVVWLLPRGGWIESVYARVIYPAIGPVIAGATQLVPFSVAAVLVVVAALTPLALAWRRLRQWRRGDARFAPALGRLSGDLVIVAAVIVHTFFLFWGYHYLREHLADRLALPPQGDDVAAVQTADRAMRAVNEAYVDVGAWNLDALEAAVDRALERTVQRLEGRAVPVRARIKKPIPRALLSWFSTTGVIVPWTLEPHVDPDLPAYYYAFTLAHEKAHLAGFAPERDANFIAWLALTTDDDPRLRYAGHFGVHRWFARSSVKRSPAVAADHQRLIAYYRKRVSKVLERGQKKVYRAYLEMNRVKAGLADYRAVAELIHRWELAHPPADARPNATPRAPSPPPNR